MKNDSKVMKFFNSPIVSAVGFLYFFVQILAVHFGGMNRQNMWIIYLGAVIFAVNLVTDLYIRYLKRQVANKSNKADI